MLRRDFLAGAAVSPITAKIQKKTKLEAALAELEDALKQEPGIHRFELRYDPMSKLPVFVAAYGAENAT